MQAPGEQFVRIALVADIEQQPIVAEVEDVMQGDGEFDHAEIWREVTAAPGDLLAHDVADFRRHRGQLRDREFFQVGGRFEVGEQRQVHGRVGIGDCGLWIADFGLDPGRAMLNPQSTIHNPQSTMPWVISVRSFRAHRHGVAQINQRLGGRAKTP